MKYRKRPPIIEAFQYGFDKKPTWMIAADAVFATNNGAWLSIPTPSGDARAMLGDYIVRDEEGNIFPMPADVFLASYEKILES